FRLPLQFFRGSHLTLSVAAAEASAEISDGDEVKVEFLRAACLTNTVSLPPHDAFFNLRRLVYGPMASAADIAGAFTFASMSFGITFESSETVILQRNRRIDRD